MLAQEFAPDSDQETTMAEPSREEASATEEPVGVHARAREDSIGADLNDPEFDQEESFDTNRVTAAE